MSGTPTVAPGPARPPRRRGRAVAGAAALICGTLLVAGCASGSSGGSGGSGTAGTARADAGGPGGEFAAYLQCLEQNGYTPPARPSGAPSGMPHRSGRPEGWNPSDRPSGWPSGRPSGWPSGRPSAWPSGMPGGMRGGGFGMGNTADPAYQKAAAACESKRPSFGGGRSGGGGNGGGSNGSAESSALRAFADCMKDKGVTVASGGTNPLAGLSTADPRTAAALKTCRPLLPSAGAAPAPSASPSA
ncbi:hypothetical protein [Peterkaempfera bronchialis]|uniref:hypothetical protein n=1 Tax=Peterkaempfera bronchialis TaxID=2126346 RepID=UPI003C2BC7F6